MDEHILNFTGNEVEELLEKVKNNDFESMQPKLESGVNIKTINGNSILGSGNMGLQNGSDGASKEPSI